MSAAGGSNPLCPALCSKKKKKKKKNFDKKGRTGLLHGHVSVVHMQRFVCVCVSDAVKLSAAAPLVGVGGFSRSEHPKSCHCLSNHGQGWLQNEACCDFKLWG